MQCREAQGDIRRNITQHTGAIPRNMSYQMPLSSSSFLLPPFPAPLPSSREDRVFEVHHSTLRRSDANKVGMEALSAPDAPAQFTRTQKQARASVRARTCIHIHIIYTPTRLHNFSGWDELKAFPESAPIVAEVLKLSQPGAASLRDPSTPLIRVRTWAEDMQALFDSGEMVSTEMYMKCSN